ALRLARRRVLEQSGIMALDRGEVSHQRGGECIAPLEPEEACETLHSGALRWQCMRLLVRDHLQAMLDRAQKPIGGVEFGAGGLVDPSTLDQRAQRRERLGPAHFRVAAAGDAVLGLGEKLSLPAAAPAALDVVSCDRNLPPPA